MVYKKFLILLTGTIIIVFLYNLPTHVVGVEEQTTPPFSKEPSIDNALKLISSNNPMQGIFMLRKILEKEPNNKEALFNLGILSIQSKQFTNAIDRFNQLLIIDSLDKRAYLHLGISNFELGNKKEADTFFNKVLKSKDTLLIEQLHIFLNNKSK